MSRLDLIEASLYLMGLRHKVSSRQIVGECPSHKSFGMPFTASLRNDGRVVMHCCAGCTRDQLMDSMGLDQDQPMFEQLAKPASEKLGNRGHTSLEMVAALAEHDELTGRRLEGADLTDYRNSLVRLYGQGRAA